MKKKKRYPTYKELIKMKLEDKRIMEQIKLKEEIEDAKRYAEQWAIKKGLDTQDVFNAMGLYRFDI